MILIFLFMHREFGLCGPSVCGGVCSALLGRVARNPRACKATRACIRIYIYIYIYYMGVCVRERTKRAHCVTRLIDNTRDR